MNFYEIMIYFITEALKPAFDGCDISELENELNRLFRSNLFNQGNNNKISNSKCRSNSLYHPGSIRLN